jgi:hypothetical protein
LADFEILDFGWAKAVSKYARVVRQQHSYVVKLIAPAFPFCLIALCLAVELSDASTSYRRCGLERFFPIVLAFPY